MKRKIIVGTLLTLWVFGCGIFLADDWHYRSYIPDNIAIGKTRFSNSDLLGVTEGCGVHVYQLLPRTKSKITTQGLSFFTDASGQMGNLNWQPTPRTDWQRSENWVYELQCIRSPVPGNLMKLIMEGARTPGGYYAATPERQWMILPKQNLVVFSHRG